MHGTVSALHAEWQSTLALEMRLMYAVDAADIRRDEGPASEVGYEVAAQLKSASFDFSKEAEVLLWRTASAYAVLGITVLDRLIAGRPPLPDSVVGKLCQEPLFGEFEAAVGIPVEQLLVARDAAGREHARSGRRAMASMVEQAYECLADEETPAPKDRSAVARERLSVNAPEGFDTPWLGYLDPLVALARQTPFEISTYLKQPA